MNCARCNQKAVLQMRQHKLALCKTHYLEWVPQQVERAIEKYLMFSSQERLLVAVSGGKDSLSLWDILIRLGYAADGLYIGLGIEGSTGYSTVSRQKAEAFAKARGLHLQVVDVKETYGSSVPVFAEQTQRGRAKPCSVCGAIKRHIMNEAASRGGYQVLVTGHNLDDEVATLFANTLSWSGSRLARQSPVLEATEDGFVRKAKPLCRMLEREMAAYALLSGIDYIYEECPFSEDANSLYYKEIFNRLEGDRPGAKQHFYIAFLDAKEKGLFSPQADTGKENLHPCPTCGQPTSAPGECTFCRLTKKVWDADKR